MLGLYAILGLSLNIILGHAGLFHMGHVAFYADALTTEAAAVLKIGIPSAPERPYSEAGVTEKRKF